MSFEEKIDFQIIPIKQCDEEPEFIIESYKTIKNEVERINAIIADDNRLELAYKEMVAKSLPLSAMQPYVSHYVRALYHRGILPDMISKRKKAAILNNVRCETHREVLIAYLNQILAEYE